MVTSFARQWSTLCQLVPLWSPHWYNGTMPRPGMSPKQRIFPLALEDPILPASITLVTNIHPWLKGNSIFFSAVIKQKCFLVVFDHMVSKSPLTNYRHKPRVSRQLPDWTLHWWACPLPSNGLLDASMAYPGEKSRGCHGNNPCHVWRYHHP